MKLITLRELRAFSLGIAQHLWESYLLLATLFVWCPWTLTIHHLANIKGLKIGGMGTLPELLNKEDVSRSE